MSKTKKKRKRRRKNSKNSGAADRAQANQKVSVHIGKELEDMVEEIAERNGWRVDKRKKYGDRILDLVISKGGTIFVIQCKNTNRATPADVTQAKKDYEAFVEWLLEDRLGYRVVPILVSQSFSDKTRTRARSYGVLLYTVDEIQKLLSARKSSPASLHRQ